MPRRRLGATDDPVADWGPDSSHGLFDGPESSASGEVTGHEVTASRAPGEAERPVAVLAWIGATLSVAAGNPRGAVPALEALVRDEPLDLLPGGFFPLADVRGEPAGPTAGHPPLGGPAGAPNGDDEHPPGSAEDQVLEPDGSRYSRAPSAEPAGPPIRGGPPIPAGPLRHRSAAWEERALFALLLGLALLSVRACS